jgi:hypothetical protein
MMATLNGEVLSGMSLAEVWHLGKSSVYSEQVSALVTTAYGDGDTELLIPIGWPIDGWIARESETDGDDEMVQLSYKLRLGFGQARIELRHPLLAVSWLLAHIEPRRFVVTSQLNEHIMQMVDDGALLVPPDASDVLDHADEIPAFVACTVDTAIASLGQFYIAPGPRTPICILENNHILIQDAPTFIDVEPPVSLALVRAVGTTVSDLYQQLRTTAAMSDEKAVERVTLSSILVGLALGMCKLVQAPSAR